MFIYKYDEKGVYTVAEETELDPLESEIQGKDIYLLPPNATFSEPEKKEGFAPIWDGEKWNQIEDYRGTKYWLPEDKHGDPAREMKKLGALPGGALLTEPEPTAKELKERKLTELASAFDARVSGSTDITVGDTTYTMQFNRSDSLAVQGLIELMESTGQTTGYLTQADDTTVYDVPLEDIKAVLIGMLKAYAECHAKKQEYRSQINACTTKEELNAIEFVF